MITQRDTKFGKGIRRLREKADLTQQELAEKAKLSVKYIQFIENGSRKPSLKSIYKIADALNVEVKEIFPF